MPGVLAWGYYPTNEIWLPVQVDANGKVKVDMSAINLGDLGDVDLTGLADDDFMYYDQATGLWKPRKLVDADIPATIARDAEVATAISDHAALPSVHHIKYTDAEALAAAAAGLRKIRDADNDTKVDVEETADEDKVHMDVKGVEAFVLDDNGVLSLAKQSAAKGYLPSTQTLPNGIPTKINLTAEEYDVQGEFDTTNKRFTAKTAGSYLVVGMVNYYYLDVLDGKSFATAIYKNGASILGMGDTSGVAGAGISPQIVGIISLAVNNYLELYGTHWQGVDTRLNSGANLTFMIVAKIS